MRSQRSVYISHTVLHIWWITAITSKRILKMESRFQLRHLSEPTEFIRLYGMLFSDRKILITPVATGCAAYRGLVPSDRLRHLNLELANQIWMGPHAHFVHYFVSARKFVNFVAITEQDSWLGESWVDRGEVADVLAAFHGWHDQVLSIIGAADETYKWALFDRSPLKRWSVGRVTLLGDACHPMLPFMGQGAAQAIEDGATLTSCLLKILSDVPAALHLYEQLRLPRASRLQGMSATNKSRFHMPDGPAQRERDVQMASGATDWSRAAIAWLFEHDAEVIEGP
jgi:salicylate hydroxylase